MYIYIYWYIILDIYICVYIYIDILYYIYIYVYINWYDGCSTEPLWHALTMKSSTSHACSSPGSSRPSIWRDRSRPKPPGEPFFLLHQAPRLRRLEHEPARASCFGDLCQSSTLRKWTYDHRNWVPENHKKHLRTPRGSTGSDFFTHPMFMV